MRTVLTLLAIALTACSWLQAAAGVEETLERAGLRMEEFFAEAGLVASVEHVEQARFDAKGKLLSQKQADYDYLVMMQLAGNQLLTQESREFRGKAEKQSTHSLLLTKGFSLLALVVHPHFQSSFLFADQTGPEERERGLLRLSFRHVPGLRSPSVLELRDKHYPIPWKGSVWLDARTGTVTKIHAELSEDLGDLGLQALTADVAYESVRFDGGEPAVWLPKQASVDVRTAHQHWRNVHRYAGYRRFQVNTTIELGKPKEADGESGKH